MTNPKKSLVNQVLAPVYSFSWLNKMFYRAVCNNSIKPTVPFLSEASIIQKPHIKSFLPAPLDLCG